MKYTYYWQIDSENEFPMCLDEYLNCDADCLEVQYSIERGRIVLYAVYIRPSDVYINILPILEALEATSKLKHIAENHQLKLNVKQQYKNYPELAKPLTQEEQVEILKLK